MEAQGAENQEITIEEIAQSIVDGHMGTGKMRELALAGMIARHYGMKDLNLNQSFEIIRAFRDAVGNIVEEEDVHTAESNLYSVEIYLRNPDDLSGGWDIEIEDVEATSKREAADIIIRKHGILFDCFIEQGFQKFNDAWAN